MIKQGWNENNNNWTYYVNNKKVVSDWVQDGEFWYYLDEKGNMKTGWLEEGKYFYYLSPQKTDKNPKGSMVTGWISENNKWYYMSPERTARNPKGSMLTGWVKYKERWCYLMPYYVSSENLSMGQALINCYRTIDGIVYSFDKNGYWQIISLKKLKELNWINAEYVIDDLNKCCSMFNIDTPTRYRHCISQCAHESGWGKWTKEIDDGTAYEGRKDLGNIYVGDGRKFKGVGYIQLTGRDNYQALANFIGDQKVMTGVDYVSKNYPWLSAGFWWERNKMNNLCDSRASCQQISAKVNTGNANTAKSKINGLTDREKCYSKCCSIL